MATARLTRLLLGAAVLGAAADTASAGPNLPIQSPPVVGNPNPPFGLNRGPEFDPTATNGQWFRSVDDGSFSARVCQFHDNLFGFGGGVASTNAIQGVITSFTLNPSGDVTGFVITATITNDLDTLQGPHLNGSNSHGETSVVTSNLVPLLGVKLSANFADDGVQGNFPAGVFPFLGPESNVFAIDYEDLAWFSFTDTGDFYVPTWNFGDIEIGASATRDLSFGAYNPIPFASFAPLLGGSDVFVSRSTSLKISEYVDVLTADDGTAYPGLPFRSSNVSVFNSPAPVPEPSSLALVGLGAAGLVGRGWRRRRPDANGAAP